MGCIEIGIGYVDSVVVYSLIETWDVLKLMTEVNLQEYAYSLIETWDVLKFLQPPRFVPARIV